MSEDLSLEERIQQQALANLQVALALPIAYLHEKGEPIEDFIDFATDKLASGWQEVKSVQDFIDAVELNWRSFGSETLSKDSDEQQGTLVTSDFLDEELLTWLGIGREQMDVLNNFNTMMADKLGLQANWHRDGEKTVLQVSRKE